MRCSIPSPPWKPEAELYYVTPRNGEPGSADKPLPSLLPFDYALIITFALLLFPVFWMARLPFRIDLAGMASAYWGGTAVRVAFVATALAIIGLPLEQTLLPCLHRYRKEKIRLVIVLSFTAWMLFSLGAWLGLCIVVDGLALAELMERRVRAFEATLVDILIPAFYLFSGLILVFAFNHAIASIEFAGADDSSLKHLDSLLFHISVSDIARWSLAHLPHGFFGVIEWVYYGLYSQIGAAIVLTSLLAGRRHAVRLANALLIGYSIALLVFFAFPTIGPFSIDPLPLPGNSHVLATLGTQETIITKARLLWAHNPGPNVVFVNVVDYYIGFPCMHIGLPLIAIWFLRPWKRIALFLLVFDIALLVPSIILLEWHYMVDLLGGVAVALLAIWLSERISRTNPSAVLKGHTVFESGVVSKP